MRRPWRAFGLMLVLLVSSAALAQGRRGEQRREQDKEEEKAPEGPVTVALGERAPELSADGWTNIEGTPRLDRFRDRIVVLFFFRTDDSSADSIAKVNEIHKKFQPLGVVVVGMTPQKKEAAEDVVKGKEIKFVVGYGVDTEDRYEVSSFPKVYLLDTAGRLATRFHPDDDLEGHIRAQMRKTPPAGADNTSLKKRLERARAALKEKQYGRAYTLAQGVNKLAEGNAAKDAGELMKKIEEAARQWLEEARAAARADKFDEACKILADLSVRMAGTELGSQADEERGRLMGDGKVKPKVLAAMENAKGEMVNDQAAEHENAKRYLEALRLYRSVTEEYPDTEAARAASTALERLDGDAEVQQTIQKVSSEQEADRWLDIADRFAKVELYGKAREFYQRIVDAHGDAPAARLARERLEKLPEEKPDEVPPPAEDAGEDEAAAGDKG